jgi:hypothetical protein
MIRHLRFLELHRPITMIAHLHAIRRGWRPGIAERQKVRKPRVRIHPIGMVIDLSAAHHLVTVRPKLLHERHHLDPVFVPLLVLAIDPGGGGTLSFHRAVRNGLHSGEAV